MPIEDELQQISPKVVEEYLRGKRREIDGERLPAALCRLLWGKSEEVGLHQKQIPPSIWFERLSRALEVFAAEEGRPVFEIVAEMQDLARCLDEKHEGYVGPTLLRRLSMLEIVDYLEENNWRRQTGTWVWVSVDQRGKHTLLFPLEGTENQEENKGKALMELARAEGCPPEAIYAKIKARI